MASNLNDDTYHIILMCKKFRLSKDTTVTTMISGDESRHLTVTANNKVYYKSTLPNAATNCEYKIEKKKDMDMFHLYIKKAKPGFWKIDPPKDH